MRSFARWPRRRIRRGWKALGIVGGYEGLISPQQTKSWKETCLTACSSAAEPFWARPTKASFRPKSAMASRGSCPRSFWTRPSAAARNWDCRAWYRSAAMVRCRSPIRCSSMAFLSSAFPRRSITILRRRMMTFGFDSAVACATDAVDRLHSTAESHRRVMVLEVMGRYAGWIAIYAGLAGGADVILIPEIPFNYDSIAQKIDERERRGKHFSDRRRRRRRRPAGGGLCYLDRPAPESRGSPWRESALKWPKRFRSERAKKRAVSCSAICSAAAAPPTWIEPYVPCLAPRCGTDRREEFWPDGRFYRQRNHQRATQRSHRPIAHRATPWRLRHLRTFAGNLPWAIEPLRTTRFLQGCGYADRDCTPGSSNQKRSTNAAGRREAIRSFRYTLLHPPTLGYLGLLRFWYAHHEPLLCLAIGKMNQRGEASWVRFDRPVSMIGRS